MARKYTEYRCTCEICGDVFYSHRIDSKFDKPACKQKAYRDRKLKKAMERKFQLDMGVYNLFQQVVDRTPPLLPLLTEFLKDYDQDAFTRVLHIVTVTQTGDTGSVAFG